MKYPHLSRAEVPLGAITVGPATAGQQADGSWRVFANGQQIGTVEPANGGWLATAKGQSANFDNIKKAVQFIAGL